MEVEPAFPVRGRGEPANPALLRHQLLRLALVALCATTASAATQTPVADAAQQADLPAVRTLLAAGADVNQAEGDGMTPLHWAAIKDRADLATMLLSARADVRARLRIGGETPLHLAGSVGSAAVTSVLLKAGADVNAVTTAGTTPLMLAAASGNAEAVKLLAAGGANVNAAEGPKGHTALMFAAAANRAGVVKVLMELGADAGAATRVFELDDVEIPADRSAANNADQKLRRGADMAARRDKPISRPGVGGVDRQYEYNELVRAQGGLAPMHFAARQGHLASVRELVEAGVDVNQPSGGVGATPLVLAVINGHFDLAMFLLDHQADPNRAAENGVAPLYAALNCRWAPLAQYPQQQAYLQQKVTSLELLDKLLEKGADPNARLRKKVWYSGYNQDNSGIDEVGATPFWRAAYAGDVEAARLLIARGADPNIATMAPRPQSGVGLPPLPAGGPGITALHAAAGAGYLQNYAGNGHRYHPAGMMRAVKYLVEELGADVSARDHEGNTPVHYAAARGDNEMILYLMAKGADVKAVNRAGQTTVDAANGPRQRTQPYPETIKLLEQFGAKNNHRCVSC